MVSSLPRLLLPQLRLLVQHPPLEDPPEVLLCLVDGRVLEGVVVHPVYDGDRHGGEVPVDGRQ